MPGSRRVSEVATEDAVEQAYRIAAPADSVAAWYRRELAAREWRLTGDARLPDGTITLHAQRAGPPLWLLIRGDTGGRWSEYSMVGAQADSAAPGR